MHMHAVYLAGWFRCAILSLSCPDHTKFPFGSNCEIAGDYVEKQMLAHHFSHYYSRRCLRMVSELAGVISPLSGENSQLVADELVEFEN